MSGKKNDAVFVNGAPQFQCSCGGWFAPDSTLGAVFHSFPICKPYEELDPLDFVTMQRKLKEN